MTPHDRSPLFQNLNNLLIRVCNERGVKIVISSLALGEVIEHYSKDLNRISEHQKENISFHTRLGFLVFWISKLKPIVRGTIGDSFVTDINEQAAVWDSHLMLKSIPNCRGISDNIRRIKMDDEDKAFFLNKAMSFYIKNNYFSLIYAIRHRNITGDALALVYGAILNSFLYKHS